MFENLVEKQFPAPSRQLIEGKSNISKAKNGFQSSNKLHENGGSLKRRAFARLSSQLTAKRLRVVYSDDSDDEHEDNKDTKMDLDSDESYETDKKSLGKIHIIYY